MLPLEPIHLVKTNLEVEASDQREAADVIFAVETETEIKDTKLDDDTRAVGGRKWVHIDEVF